MEKTKIINGRMFKKSSFSFEVPSIKCVGVSIGTGDVQLTNLSNRNGTIITFTLDEWDAFVKGVKNSEFDID